MTGFDGGQGLGTTPGRAPRRLSQVFNDIGRDCDDRVSVANIRDALGDRSFAALLVLFGAFNLLPLPPGSSAVLGIPLLIVAAQMTFGGERAWLPRFIAEKSLSAAQFRSLLGRIVPHMTRLERYIRPRFWPFWRKQGDRTTGLIALLLAIVVTLPIPFGNWLPALSITLLGLALTERDGLLFVIGSLFGLVALGVVVFVIGAAGLATQAVLGWLI